MQSFWEGFEKQAVSVAWIKRMKDRGLITRSELPLARKADLMSKVEGAFQVGKSKKSPDKIHWRQSLDKKDIHSAVRSENMSTKNPWADVDRLADATERRPGYLHGLHGDTHKTWDKK